MRSNRRYCARCRADITHHPLPVADARGLYYCANCPPLEPHEHALAVDPDEAVCEECSVCVHPTELRSFGPRRVCLECLARLSAPPPTEADGIELVELCDICGKPFPPAQAAQVQGRLTCAPCRAALAAKRAVRPKPAPAPVVAPVPAPAPASPRSSLSSVGAALDPAEHVVFVPDGGTSAGKGASAAPPTGKPRPAPAPTSGASSAGGTAYGVAAGAAAGQKPKPAPAPKPG